LSVPTPCSSSDTAFRRTPAARASSSCDKPARRLATRARVEKFINFPGQT
jgi:hypothetical protein